VKILTHRQKPLHFGGNPDHVRYVTVGAPLYSAWEDVLLAFIEFCDMAKVCVRVHSTDCHSS